MGWESSDVVRFNPWPLLQGQAMVPGFGELSVPQGMLLLVWETFRLRRLRILFSL